MRRPRLSIADLCVITALVACDCLALRWAILERVSVVTIRGVLFMMNVLVAGMYRLGTHREGRRAFLTGFVVSGFVATLAYFDLCQVSHASMLRTQQWTFAPFGLDACHIHFVDAPSLGVTGRITPRTVVISLALAPVVLILVALPQVLVAIAGGLLARRVHRRRPVGSLAAASAEH